MRKTLLLCAICIVFMFLSGCGASSVSEEQNTVIPVSETTYSYFTLNIKYIDETENAFSASDAEFILQDGTVLSGSLTDGSVNIEKFPAATDIQCSIRNGSDKAADFMLSFWTGYASEYYNNLNHISVDIPGNIGTLFLTVKIFGDGTVKCTAMSELEFDEAEAGEDFEGAIDKNTAISAGLYGTRAVTETGVKLREDPSTESSVLRTMNFADIVMLMDQGSEQEGMTWFQVKYDEYEGYIAGDYLGKLFTVNKNGVNVRKQPTSESESVNLVSSGARVVALDEGQDVNGEKWFKVVTRSGIKGYIRSDFLG